ncbi:hypothetical protein EV189_2712 [Motilibacter rhizosphaerae]|uniref:DUF6542 domain-containing protein n=1 Tax=Motilibacter rhizosphaerae TaxID=598652 RepID=A0A4V2F4E1_9ACTN|nr:DUF6542 domain-containing protein [Motilibacter rhizosphaerae]RZS87287.1 hypothetical protein EV189_2712 [Motilibacter rhizosphaerae]
MPLFPDPDAGLPASGAGLLLSTAAFLGGLVDVALTGSLGWGFGTAFVVGSGALGLRLAGRDLVFAAILPPLAYAVAAFLCVPLTAAAHESRFPLGLALALGGALGTGAPLLLLALAAGCGAAGTRWALERRAAPAPVLVPLQGGAEEAADEAGEQGGSASEQPTDDAAGDAAEQEPQVSRRPA